MKIYFFCGGKTHLTSITESSVESNSILFNLFARTEIFTAPLFIQTPPHVFRKHSIMLDWNGQSIKKSILA